MIPLPHPHRRPRGFTLIELAIAVAISAIVLTALFGVVQSQQTAFFQGHLQRAAQGSARAALTYVEQRVMLAGYGMDAPLAFDFQYYGMPGWEQMPCPALSPSSPQPCPRDAIDGSDELVFYARNPRYWVPEDRKGDFYEPSGYAWRVRSIDPGGATVTLVARPGDAFEKGRILQLVCAGGESWAYVTVAARAPSGTGVVGEGTPIDLAITLEPSSGANPFRRQDWAASAACFNATETPPRAFLIDRFRFHVRPVPVPGGQLPYLVLDTGLDRNGDGNVDDADEIIVAEGIEFFQVGYVMMSGALATRGAKPGVRIAFVKPASSFSTWPPPPSQTGGTSGDGLTLTRYDAGVERLPDQGEYEWTSWYRYNVGPTPSIAEQRLTDNQANIRAVRIVVGARGADPNPSGRGAEGADVLTPVLNQAGLPSWVSPTVPYNRARVEVTVPVRNMLARAMNDF